MAFAALGTDDGGSNRIPAVCTGVVGIKPTFGLVPRTGVIPTWPYLDTHGPLARTVADAALMLAVIAGPDPSDSLSLGGAPANGSYTGLRDDALKGVRLGMVEAHVPREKMTPDALAIRDCVLADLRAAGATVEPFVPSVTLADYRRAFTEAERARGDVAGNSRSPAATANALYLYFSGRTTGPVGAIRRGDHDAYRSFYDVLPAKFEDCVPMLRQPLERDAAGQSFARSRADVVTALGQSMRTAGVAAMVYPTMPFNAFSLAAGWPASLWCSGTAKTGSGCRKSRCPPVSAQTACRRSTSRWPACLAKMRECWRSRTRYERQSRRFVPPGRRR